MIPLLATWTDGPPALQGVITGMTYGLLAIGLILVYRSSHLINFAQGACGALGAAVVGVGVVEHHVPYWVIFPAGIAVGAASGMLVELVAVQRLRKAPPAMSVVATLGMAAFLTALSAVVNKDIVNGAFYPSPDGMPSWTVGPLLISPAYAAELIFTPLIVIGLAAFLRYSRYGIAIRASADNREAAALSGISTARMGSIAWGFAGAVGAYAAILDFPSKGFVGSANLGTGLLLRALAAAVAARMSSLPLALVFGVVIGVAEELALWHGYTGGQVELGLFLAVFIMLGFAATRSGRQRGQSSWLAVQAWPPPPPKIARLWSVRNAGKIGFLLLVLLLLALDTLSNQDASTLTTTLAYTLVGISVYITCGLVGQLSLGQFALAGVGAVLSFQLTSHGVDFVSALILAAVLTAPIAALLAFTSLRARGLMLTVTTLALAVMAQDWLFTKSWAFGNGAAPQPNLFGHVPLDTFRRYYLFAIAVFVAGTWLVWNVSRGGLARTFIAVRDNEDGARSFGISATRRKLEAFAIAGLLAGLGGALYGGALFRIGAEAFPPDIGITVVAMSAIGGITLMMGPLFGALYLIALPGFVHFSAAATATSTVGWLVLVLYFPGGGGQLLRPVRDRTFDLLARAHGVDPIAARAEEQGVEPQLEVPVLLAEGRIATTPVPVAPADRPSSQASILSVEGMCKNFGGVVAVDDISFELEEGSVLGLIGPNGAGKTTLFEMVSGFVKPDSGITRFGGRDVSRLSPERRASIGLVRSFQDARLFPTMTVVDVVCLAYERERPTAMVASMVGWRRALRRERENRGRAEELISFMGLERYRSATVGTLSTGTRRVVELTCVLALRPRVLLLDEPSGGLAQRETEALQELLLLMRKTLDASVVVIEHDIPLITAVSDRVLAMHLGRRIAYGRPEQVIADPEVIASYLGDDAAAISRSGKTPVTLRR